MTSNSFPKYDFNIYEREGILTTEQIQQLLQIENNPANLISRLQNFIVTREISDKYQREYFNNKPIRGNTLLYQTEIDDAIIQKIQNEQRYHIGLLFKCGILSESEKNKITSYIDNAYLSHLRSIFSIARNYKTRKKEFQNTLKRMEPGLADGIYTSLPSVDDIHDSYDFVPFYTHSKIIYPVDYQMENGETDVVKLMNDIISFLPNNEIFGKVFTEIREDGREIYYTVRRDLMVTIIANGKPFSWRHKTGYKYLHRNQEDDFRINQTSWDFGHTVDIFNKIYHELGMDHRLDIFSELPHPFNYPMNNAHHFAIVLTNKKHPRVAYVAGNKLDVNDLNFRETDVDDFVDKLEASGLLQFYSNEQIEQVRHLAKSSFMYALERMFWFFDFFPMAICPRENMSYQYFMDLIPKITHGRVLFEEWHEDIPNGVFGFTLNGKKYETNQLLKNQCDPYFVFLLNEAMAEQNLGQLYKWNNEFDPHEQFSIIYSTPEVFAKICTWRHPSFSLVEEATIQFWRE